MHQQIEYVVDFLVILSNNSITIYQSMPIKKKICFKIFSWFTVANIYTKDNCFK